MRILGVDPGLQATGYGVIEVAKNHQISLLEVGTIEPKTKDLLQNRIQKIYKNLDEILVQFSPDVMVVEKLYAHYRHPTTACLLGHVRGVIFLLSAQRQIKLVEHSVKRIRQSLLGNGNATKEQTRETVCHILKVDGRKLPLDASDALALGLGYAFMQRFRSDTEMEKVI